MKPGGTIALPPSRLLLFLWALFANHLSLDTHTPAEFSSSQRSLHLSMICRHFPREKKKRKTNGARGMIGTEGWRPISWLEQKIQNERQRQRKRRQKSAADWRKKSISQRGDFIRRTEKGMGKDCKFTDGVVDLEEKL